MATKETKTIAANRVVRHEYFIDEAFEAGIALTGTEVKSLRAGTVNLKDSWIDIGSGELVVRQMHISPYDKGNIFNVDPLRGRKLLMHRREINRLYILVRQQSYTLIPLSIYFKGSLVKMQVGLCRGKKLYDKREDQAKRDAKRDIDRAMKDRAR
ncbi:MAG: SsrA-binding protein SmpB [Oscillospiraceae bacterium]